MYRKKQLIIITFAVCISLMLPCFVSAQESDSPFSDFYSQADQKREDSISDDLIQDVLDALNNENCTKTLEAFRNGETVTNGTYSETAAGLQQTLADLGCEISVDGSAGPATFQTLNNTLAAFGEDETDTVDEDLYTELLFMLLISTADEDISREILKDRFVETENSSEFEYLRACALYAKGHYYEAQEAFENSRFQDYESRAESCVQAWPQNGELWHRDGYYSDSMYLTFIVNSYDESEGMVFEVYTYDGDLVSVLFLTGSGSVTTGLPGGVYRIRDNSGYTWYGRKDAFGPDHSWEYMKFYEYDDDEYATDLPAGYEWSITINVSEYVEGASGVGSTYIPWDLPENG